MSTNINSKKDIEYKNNILLKIIVVIISLTLLLQTGFGIWYFVFGKTNNEIIINNNSEKDDNDNYYSVGEKFEFDGLEILVSKNYSLLRVDNIYSSYNNKIVVRVPVTIKNNKEGKYMLNIYDYKIYGPLDNELDEVAGYFEESLFYAEELDSGESYSKYLYFLYDTNGNYSIKFNNGIERERVLFYIENKGNIKSYEEITKNQNKDFYI